MLNKLFYNLSMVKRYSMFLEVIGYLSFSEHEQSLSSLSFEKFDKAMNYLSKSEKSFKKLNSDSPREKALYSILKARVAYLSQDYVLSASCLDDAFAQTFKMENIKNSSLKDIFLFSVELMKIQNSVSAFIVPIEKKLQQFDLELIENKEKINRLIIDYDKQIINSPEHLEATKNHLELMISNAKIETKLEDFLDASITNQAENIIYQINFVINKMFSNALLRKDEMGNVLPGNRSRFPMFIYIYLMIEKLKLNYYLRNKESSLQSVVEIVTILINLNHDDPLGVIRGEIIPLEIYQVSALIEPTFFLEYMKSFQIKLYKASKSLKFFNLTMFAQEKCETKEDRLKLFWVSEQEIYEMNKNKTASQG